MGADLARKLATRALTTGHVPKQKPLAEPLNIRGVGNGSQACNWSVTCPIATPTGSSSSVLSTLTTPVVEGSGKELPGLLGLKTLESQRAILDVENRMLHFPGPGEVKIVLPPGSVSHPLEKAPSGHLVLVIDDYERVVAPQKGGVAEEPVNLLAQSASDPAAYGDEGQVENTPVLSQTRSTGARQGGCLEASPELSPADPAYLAGRRPAPTRI